MYSSTTAWMIGYAGLTEVEMAMRLRDADQRRALRASGDTTRSALRRIGERVAALVRRDGIASDGLACCAG